MLLTPDGLLDRIVEYKDASESERAINLCNAGCYAADARKFFRWAAALNNDNAQKEYYLTDVPALARGRRRQMRHARWPTRFRCMGVNSRAELAEAESRCRRRMRAAAAGRRRRHDRAGNGVLRPRHGAGSRCGDRALCGVRPRRDGANAARASEAIRHLEGAEVAGGAIIGPFARLRPGAEIGEDAHIGNFVEVKNTVIGKGAKANHLTYLGDAHGGRGRQYRRGHHHLQL